MPSHPLSEIQLLTERIYKVQQDWVEIWESMENFSARVYALVEQRNKMETDNTFHSIEQRLLTLAQNVEIRIRLYEERSRAPLWGGQKVETAQNREPPKLPLKFIPFIKVIQRLGIPFENLVIHKSVVQWKTLLVIHYPVNGSEKTVVLSDEIQMATYVYEWFLSTEKFSSAYLWQVIDNTRPIKVIFSTRFEEKLTSALLRSTRQMPNLTFKSFSDNISREYTGKTEELESYRQNLIDCFEDLEAQGIEDIDGKIFVGDFQIPRGSIFVWGKLIWNFPEMPFIRLALGWWTWVVTNGTDFWKILEALGFTVATKEEQKRRWGKVLVDHAHVLEKQCWLRYIQNVGWAMSDMKWSSFWPQISWGWNEEEPTKQKNLVSFPSSDALKELLLDRPKVVAKGQLSSRDDFKALLLALGESVID